MGWIGWERYNRFFVRRCLIFGGDSEVCGCGLDAR